MGEITLANNVIIKLADEAQEHLGMGHYKQTML
jgi:hypothetical protein